MPSNPRIQLLDLIQAFKIDYLLDPVNNASPLVNLGVKSGLPEAQVMNGAALIDAGLFKESAAILLDGEDDYLDLNWEPISFTPNYTIFGISKLLSESDKEEVVVWFQVVEGETYSIQMRVIRSASAEQGSLLPLGIALRILTYEEIEALSIVLSELASIRWGKVGVEVDNSLTGVSVEQTFTGVSGP